MEFGLLGSVGFHFGGVVGVADPAEEEVVDGDVAGQTKRAVEAFVGADLPLVERWGSATDAGNALDADGGVGLAAAVAFVGCLHGKRGPAKAGTTNGGRGHAEA